MSIVWEGIKNNPTIKIKKDYKFMKKKHKYSSYQFSQYQTYKSLNSSSSSMISLFNRKALPATLSKK